MAFLSTIGLRPRAWFSNLEVGLRAKKKNLFIPDLSPHIIVIRELSEGSWW
jgi:hypothetical protein